MPTSNEIMAKLTANLYSVGAVNTNGKELHKALEGTKYTYQPLDGGSRYTFADGSVGEYWYNGGEYGKHWTYLIPV